MTRELAPNASVLMRCSIPRSTFSGSAAHKHAAANAAIPTNHLRMRGKVSQCGGGLLHLDFPHGVSSHEDVGRASCPALTHSISAPYPARRAGGPEGPSHVAQARDPGVGSAHF